MNIIDQFAERAVKYIATRNDQPVYPWQGKTAMRISVSCWATTQEDLDRSLGSILRHAGARENQSILHV